MDLRYSACILLATGLIMGCGEPNTTPDSVVPGTDHLTWNFQIDNPVISRGETGEFILILHSTTNAPVPIPKGSLEAFSVKVRETGESFGNLVSENTYMFPGGNFPDIQLVMKHKIFTEIKQQMPEGVSGPIGLGVVVEEKGRYHLDLQHHGVTIASRKFRIK